MNIKKDWFVSLLGKPWSRTPEPPRSFNCGELVRYCYKEFLGIEANLIPSINTASRVACAKVMVPEFYDLVPLDRKIKNFDVCLLGKYHFLHCGMACFTNDGMSIIHCPENNMGVCLNSELELNIIGFPKIKWFRHKDLA